MKNNPIFTQDSLFDKLKQLTAFYGYVFLTEDVVDKVYGNYKNKFMPEARRKRFYALLEKLVYAKRVAKLFTLSQDNLPCNLYALIINTELSPSQILERHIKIVHFVNKWRTRDYLKELNKRITSSKKKKPIPILKQAKEKTLVFPVWVKKEFFKLYSPTHRPSIYQIWVDSLEDIQEKEIKFWLVWLLENCNEYFNVPETLIRDKLRSMVMLKEYVEYTYLKAWKFLLENHYISPTRPTYSHGYEEKQYRVNYLEKRYGLETPHYRQAV